MDNEDDFLLAERDTMNVSKQETTKLIKEADELSKIIASIIIKSKVNESF
jgi:hypothetical protein